MSDTGLVLIAASGLARETAEAARAAGVTVGGVLDDNGELWGSQILPGVSVLGGLDLVSELTAHRFVLCAGRGSVRRSLAARLKGLGIDEHRYGTVIHPTTSVPPSCAIGAGGVLLGGTVLTADVSLGRHVVCMPHVVITHDCRVDDFATVCSGVTLGGGVSVGEAAYLGMSCSIREHVTVGADSFIGMGSVVLDDIDPGLCVVGIPARQHQGGGEP